VFYKNYNQRLKLLNIDLNMADTVTREVYIENTLDYSKFILDPKIGEKYPEITKDLPLTHFDKFEERIALLRQEIMNIIILKDCKPWLINSYESFERDQHCMVQICRSKFGFESKLQRTKMAGDIQGERGFEKEKAKTIFGQKQ